MLARQTRQRCAVQLQSRSRSGASTAPATVGNLGPGSKSIKNAFHENRCSFLYRNTRIRNFELKLLAYEASVLT